LHARGACASGSSSWSLVMAYLCLPRAPRGAAGLGAYPCTMLPMTKTNQSTHSSIGYLRLSSQATGISVPSNLHFACTPSSTTREASLVRGVANFCRAKQPPSSSQRALLTASHQDSFASTVRRQHHSLLVSCALPAASVALTHPDVFLHPPRPPCRICLAFTAEEPR
jgi:hypothetical protein